MLADFIDANRDAITSLTRARADSRTAPPVIGMGLGQGIPLFLDQLVSALRTAQSSDIVDHSDIGRSATEHGHTLLRMGFSVGQVVHDYGDVCQAVTELAVQQQVPIAGGEFRTLNLCLDDAIAGAVTEYSRQRELRLSDEGTERLGFLAHELRNLINSAMLSFEIVRRGQVAPGGSTGMVLGRSLIGLRNLVDRSLADVRLDIGIEHVEQISVAELIEEIEIGASMQARARSILFRVASVERAVTIEGDRQTLTAAVANLLQNAFKFTPEHGRVSLTAIATNDRVLIEVEDTCGGLPPGKAEELFLPFSQRGSDRSGLGLGLAIALKAAQANGGNLRVRDIPGEGCVFTLDLPRKPPPPLSAIDGGKNKPGAPPAAGGALGKGAGGVTGVG